MKNKIYSLKIPEQDTIKMLDRVEEALHEGNPQKKVFPLGTPHMAINMDRTIEDLLSIYYSKNYKLAGNGDANKLLPLYEDSLVIHPLEPAIVFALGQQLQDFKNALTKPENYPSKYTTHAAHVLDDVGKITRTISYEKVFEENDEKIFFGHKSFIENIKRSMAALIRNSMKQYIDNIHGKNDDFSTEISFTQARNLWKELLGIYRTSIAQTLEEEPNIDRFDLIASLQTHMFLYENRHNHYSNLMKVISNDRFPLDDDLIGIKNTHSLGTLSNQAELKIYVEKESYFKDTITQMVNVFNDDSLDAEMLLTGKYKDLK